MDRYRGAYGIKETIFAKVFIHLLNIGGSDASKLKNYKAPTANKTVVTDFAAVLYEVIKDRAYHRSKISIFEINAKLDDIIYKNANDGLKAVEEVLKVDLFKKMDAIQV